MNLPETARLLTMIAAFNNRTIGEADVIAWQSVLPDVPLEDAEEAVRRHYAENTEWLMPAHVRRLVRDIRTEREMTARATGWAPGQAGVPKDRPLPEITGRIADGDVSGEMRELIRELLAERFPDASREKLMPRRVYWEREHRAYTRVAEPNPRYRPQAVRPESLGDLCVHNWSCRPERPCAAQVPHWWEETPA